MESFGRYQLHEKLGQGGMGVVYRAFDSVLERTVALKVVLPNVLDDELRARLFREARAAGNLKHKNIVTIYDLGEHEGRPYLAMEFLEGEDLQHRLARPEKMSLLYKIDLAIEMCDGLGYAHAHGVIHRDIKPANIFIIDSGGAKIVDFGLARLMTSQLTRSNMLMGTLNYMAPEQVRGERADQRSDIFSTGVVLYELFGGRKAFDGDTVASTLYKILQDVPEPLSKLDAALPRDLAQVVERMLAKLPDERYQTMDQVRRDLEACRDRYRAGDRSTPVPLELSSPLLETIAAGGFAAPTLQALRDSGAVPAPRPTPLPAPAPEVSPKPTAASIPAGPDSGATPVPPASIAAQGGGRRNAAMVGITSALLLAAVAGGVWWFAGHATEPAPASAAALPAVVPTAPVAVAPPPSQAAGTESAPAKEAAPSESRRSSAADDAPTTGSKGNRASDRERAAGGSRRRAAAQPTAPVKTAPPEPPSKTQIAGPPPMPAAPVTTTPPESVGSPVASRPPTPTPPESVPPRAPSSPSSGSAAATSPPAAANPPAAAPAAAAQDRIAALLDQYRQALEDKNMEELKHIWPSLGGNAEAAIRQEFSHAASISVSIQNAQITVSGTSAQVRFVRNYSLMTVDGQHLQSTTHAVIDARKTGTNWVIGAIRFSER